MKSRNDSKRSKSAWVPKRMLRKAGAVALTSLGLFGLGPPGSSRAETPRPSVKPTVQLLNRDERSRPDKLILTLDQSAGEMSLASHRSHSSHRSHRSHSSHRSHRSHSSHYSSSRGTSPITPAPPPPAPPPPPIVIHREAPSEKSRSEERDRSEQKGRSEVRRPSRPSDSHREHIRAGEPISRESMRQRMLTESLTIKELSQQVGVTRTTRIEITEVEMWKLHERCLFQGKDKQRERRYTLLHDSEIRRMVPEESTRELRDLLLQDPEWTLEEGQDAIVEWKFYEPWQRRVVVRITVL